MLTALSTGALAGMGGGILQDLFLFRKIPSAFKNASGANALNCAGLCALFLRTPPFNAHAGNDCSPAWCSWNSTCSPPDVTSRLINERVLFFAEENGITGCRFPHFRRASDVAERLHQPRSASKPDVRGGKEWAAP
ncbi:hypothetical protein HFO21_07905 [Rhizobium laguerreae]|uniref:hypothetical protein n=1 Tax=Rhizobium laguerreae TaxID=1076926 RepID=UPI001C9026E8|nr:hypothetical protein [Rhizobium laguerreae]MBY3214298.1 hypothetical protein [Rhizobium laguerreae]